jgi:hypothetical protein
MNRKILSSRVSTSTRDTGFFLKYFAPVLFSMTRKGQPLALRKTRRPTIRKTLTATKSLESVRWTVENPPAHNHWDIWTNGGIPKTGTLRLVESVRGGRRRAKNRRRIDAYTYALVESVREGCRKIDDECKGKASLTQECTCPSTRHRTNNRRERRRHSVKSALVPSKIEGGRTGVRVERGYLRSSQKGKDETQQTGADRRRIHRCAVHRHSRQTPHHLPCTISAPASVSAHSTPRSLPLKHSVAGMRATPPALPPSETLCYPGARNAPDSLPPK